jgi:AcrR family transcriptional regulator
MRRADLVKAKVMEHARALFGEKGYEGFSLRELAMRAQYTPTALYRHFANKDAILTELVVEGFHLFETALAASQEAATGDAVQRLRSLGDAYVAFGLAHPIHYRLMFLQRSDLFMDAIRARGEKAIPDTLRLLSEALAAIDPSGGSEILAARTLALWSAVHGLTTLLLTGGQSMLPSSVDAALDEMTRMAACANGPSIGR